MTYELPTLLLYISAFGFSDIFMQLFYINTIQRKFFYFSFLVTLSVLFYLGNKYFS